MDMQERQSYRYERKFLIKELEVAQVRNLVMRHPAMFYQSFPPRFVNNLYLDTEDLHYYYANVDGLDERCKVRVRWYGELLGQLQKPVLEFKIKKGLVGIKNNYPFPLFTMDDRLENEQFRNIVQQAELPGDKRQILRDLSVVLCNRYFRWYYVSRDQHFRITVDTKMEYYHMRRRGVSLLQRYFDPSTVVLELKYDEPYETKANRIGGFFPFGFSKNSKYVTGIERVYFA